MYVSAREVQIYCVNIDYPCSIDSELPESLIFNILRSKKVQFLAVSVNFAVPPPFGRNFLMTP